MRVNFATRFHVFFSHLDDLARGIRTFDDFRHQGIIEYLDVNEENNGMFTFRNLCSFRALNIVLKTRAFFPQCAGEKLAND